MASSIPIARAAHPITNASHMQPEAPLPPPFSVYSHPCPKQAHFLKPTSKLDDPEPVGRLVAIARGVESFQELLNLTPNTRRQLCHSCLSNAFAN